MESKERMTWRRWLGLGDKTIWDWASLLIVPIVLAVGGYWFSMQQDARQQAIEEQRAQDEALQSYFDQMSVLLITEKLRTSPEDSEARALARSRTLTILSRVDPRRKSRALQFLLEAELVQRIDEKNPVINLSGANLRDVVVPADTNLSYTDLSATDLSDADLSHANLSTAYLTATDLSHADLSGATLSFSDLGLADLSDANLSNADLSLAKLNDTDLTGADLTGADLWRADLTDAKGVTQDTLVEQAGYVGQMTMPDGHYVAEQLTTDSKWGEYPSGKIPPGIPGMRIQPGEYDSDEFVPAFHFEVAEGWQATGILESTTHLTLAVGVKVKGGEYASSEGELVITNPSYVLDASNQSEQKEILAPENADGWVSWFEEHPKLDTSKLSSVSVGAASGMQIDAAPTSTLENYPQYCKLPCVELYNTSYSRVTAYGHRIERFLIVDVGEETVVINISAPADKPKEFFSKAQKLLDTLEWNPDV